MPDDETKRTAYLVLDNQKQLVDAYVESERYAREAMFDAARQVAAVVKGVVLETQVVADFRPGRRL